MDCIKSQLLWYKMSAIDNDLETRTLKFKLKNSNYVLKIV